MAATAKEEMLQVHRKIGRRSREEQSKSCLHRMVRCLDFFHPLIGYDGIGELFNISESTAYRWHNHKTPQSKQGMERINRISKEMELCIERIKSSIHNI